MKTMKRAVIVVVFLINAIVVFSQNQYSLLAFVEKMEWWIPYSKFQDRYQGDIKPMAEINSSYNGLVHTGSLNYVKLGDHLYEAVVILDREKQHVALYKLEPKEREAVNSNPLKRFNSIFKDLTALYGEPYLLYDEKDGWKPQLNHVVKQFGWRVEGDDEPLMVVLNWLKDVPWDLSFDRKEHQPCFVFIDIMPGKTMEYMTSARKGFFNRCVQGMKRVGNDFAPEEGVAESCFFDKPWDLVTGLNVKTDKRGVKHVREGYSVDVLYKLDGNNIYCGQTNKLLFTIEDNSIKDVISGKSVCDIEGNSVKSSTGKILYTIDGNFIRQRGSNEVFYTIK